MQRNKSNLKSLRKTKKRTIRNKIVINNLKYSVKNNRREPKVENLSEIYRKADSALTKGKITKNKCNRIKSRATLLVNKTMKANMPVQKNEEK